jgi:ABC-2 type transport system ATP-binding protein
VSRTNVWDEVRYLNRELGMTIFLTTQYLEEADALADRVGIIASGKIATEGTPTDLKREIGADVVVVRVEKTDAEKAADGLRSVEGVERIETDGDELTVAVRNGSASISPIAIRLAEAGVQVKELTLRTPSLDDVFLHATGARMRDDEEGIR